MAFLPLKFQPGLTRDMTHYSNINGWYDSDKVRFRLGLPEKIGGWTKQITTAFLGTCRALINWTILNGLQYLGLGTNLKYYVSSGSTYTDVTPLRDTNNLGANPFTSTLGSTTVQVTDVGNGSILGDYVTFSAATTFAGIPAAELNINHEITGIIDADNYTIAVTTAATSGTTGGGAAPVVAAYEIHIGLDTTIIGTGWGSGVWGRGTWGSSATAGVTIELRLWSHDTFGEDLIANVRNGGIYYWDATTPTARMVELSTLGGASNTPVVATQIVVSAQENHVIAFGCDPIGGGGVQDPMQIRWGDTQSLTNFTSAATNTAGGYRLAVGTRIVAVLETLAEMIIWTDAAVYTMTWTGAPYTFSFKQIAANASTFAPNATGAANDIVAWMGHEQFYLYNGRVVPLNCQVADYVFNRLNIAQSQKVFCFANSHFDEIGWLYPSTDSDECDSYVMLNYKDNIWYIGSIERTAWLDRGPSFYPLATDPEGYLYNHEFGFDDGSTNPPSAIEAYIQSSPIEVPAEGPGNHFMFIDRLIPDVTFRNSSAASPSVTMTVKMQDYPGATYAQTNASTVTQSSTVTVEQFTQQCFIRLRGRSAVFRIASDGLGVTWRLGIPRLGVRVDGRR